MCLQTLSLHLGNGCQKPNIVRKTPSIFQGITCLGLLLISNDSVSLVQICHFVSIIPDLTLHFLPRGHHYSGYALAWISSASSHCDGEGYTILWCQSSATTSIDCVGAWAGQILEKMFSKKFSYEEIVALIDILESYGHSCPLHSTQWRTEHGFSFHCKPIIIFFWIYASYVVTRY